MKIPLPALAINEETSEEQLKKYGKRLVNHCDSIEGKQQRTELSAMMVTRRKAF